MNDYQHQVVFNFKAAKIPELKEIPTRRNYYMAGEDNKFFDHLIEFYSKGNVHSSFVKNLGERITGSGLQPATEADQATIKKYNLNDLFGKISFDYSLYGGFAIEVIWNALHTQITRLNYLDFSKVRSGFVDPDTDKVQLFYFTPDWFKYNKEIEVYPVFNKDVNSDFKQIYYFKDRYPGDEIYPRPDYISGLKWIYTEIEVNNYYANLVKNNFVANTLLSVPGIFDDEKRLNFEKSLKDFTGGDAAGSIFVIYNEGGADAMKPDILKFNNEADDNKYQWLSEHIIEQLIIAHRIPSPMLAGVKTPGQLGGSEELKTSEKIYNLQVVHPKRNDVLNVINDFIPYLGGPLNYTVNDMNIFSDENIV